MRMLWMMVKGESVAEEGMVLVVVMGIVSGF